MNKDDGGPAFPAPEASVARFGEGNADAFLGMTLRDYFAAKALAPAFPGMSTRDVQYAAEAAYELADAMLSARSA
ncbi:hypothetical protein ACOI7N_13730 [Pseudomonas sp. P2758]|uniref:hypothetical protein n=1 Tax=Pseudomonas sp. P2758 TaxID=3409916 RepID=UPI003B5A24D0